VTKPVEKTSRRYGEGAAGSLVRKLRCYGKGPNEARSHRFSASSSNRCSCKSSATDCGRIAAGHRAHNGGPVERYSNVDNALREFYEMTIAAAVGKKLVSEGRLRQWFETSSSRQRNARNRIRGHRGDGWHTQCYSAPSCRRASAAWRLASRRIWYEITHDRFIEPILASNRAWKERRRS